MKEIYIFDSTPLIYVGKVKVLHQVKHLLTRNIIPSTVFQEVVITGKERGEKDALYVEELVTQNLFEVKKVTEPHKILQKNTFLSNADVDVLTLAYQHKGRAITDDEEVRMVGKIEKINTGGTLYILLKLVELRVISKKECKRIVDEIITQGWRCSAEIYAFIIQKLE